MYYTSIQLQRETAILICRDQAMVQNTRTKKEKTKNKKKTKVQGALVNHPRIKAKMRAKSPRCQACRQRAHQEPEKENSE